MEFCIKLFNFTILEISASYYYDLEEYSRNFSPIAK